jgi:hypothetical protein
VQQHLGPPGRRVGQDDASHLGALAALSTDLETWVEFDEPRLVFVDIPLKKGQVPEVVLML